MAAWSPPHTEKINEMKAIPKKPAISSMMMPEIKAVRSSFRKRDILPSPAGFLLSFVFLIFSFAMTECVICFIRFPLSPGGG